MSAPDRYAGYSMRRLCRHPSYAPPTVLSRYGCRCVGCVSLVSKCRVSSQAAFKDRVVKGGPTCCASAAAEAWQKLSKCRRSRAPSGGQLQAPVRRRPRSAFSSEESSLALSRAVRKPRSHPHVVACLCLVRTQCTVPGTRVRAAAYPVPGVEPVYPKVNSLCGTITRVRDRVWHTPMHQRYHLTALVDQIYTPVDRLDGCVHFTIVFGKPVAVTL